VHSKISHVDFGQIDKSIKGILESFPPQFLNYLKENFEQNIFSFIGGAEPFTLDLKLVTDSEPITSALISYARKGESIIHKIIKEPFLRLYAPPTINKEIEKNIVDLSEELAIDKDILAKHWRQDILPHLTVCDVTDPEALSAAEALGIRHLSDVPFVALHFQLGTHGIVTKDRHITEHSTVRTWKISGMVGLTTVFKKGAFSFYIFYRVLPDVLSALFRIGTAILRTILEALVAVVSFFANLADRAVRDTPDWLKLVIGGILIGLIMVEKTRNIMIEGLKRLVEAIAKFAHEVYDAMGNLLEKLAPLVRLAFTVLACLLDSYQETIRQLHSLGELNV